MMNVDVDVPEGVSGVWRVENFTVSEQDAKRERMYAVFHGGRGVPAGDYVRLMRGGRVIMSNTPDEIRDHSPIRWNATGKVLINGLGLGVVIEMIIDQVQHITVVEKSADVIDLCANHYRTKYPDKIEVIQADALEYQPPKGIRYNAVWHDIWDDICTDNLISMGRLHRKYGRRADWQGSWSREDCLYYRRLGY